MAIPLQQFLCVAGMASRPLACRSSVIEDTTTKSSRPRSRSKGATQNQTISRTTKMNETGTKENQTPYSAWLQTEILHTLQQTVSNHPGEYAFMINAQVQELYWALIVKEMQAALACLREDNLAEAHEALLKVVDHHEPLNATWRSPTWIAPSDLMPIWRRSELHTVETRLIRDGPIGTCPHVKSWATQSKRSRWLIIVRRM